MNLAELEKIANSADFDWADANSSMSAYQSFCMAFKPKRVKKMLHLIRQAHGLLYALEHAERITSPLQKQWLKDFERFERGE